MNTTYDSSRDLRRTRLILLSTLLFVGLTGCSIVLVWFVRYIRWNTRSARTCSLILNLIIANISVYIFATGIQIFWELQTNRQWPFNDFLCRLVKFFQSFSILSSTYIVVAMAIDRCIAIVTPLNTGKIRVLYLCGTAWTLAGLLSIPNIFIFGLQANDKVRYCTAIFNRQTSLTGRRIYLTFISLVVYFIPFIVLVLCYLLIFIKLLFREQKGDKFISRSSSSNFYPRSSNNKNLSFSQRSSGFQIQQQRVNTYAKARSKTFRMIIVLVLFMILFGAPYYCLELYVAYTGRQPSDSVLALAGGAAVAPSSIDPWIFLLFWVSWNEPRNVHTRRQIININLQQQQGWLRPRQMNRTNTSGQSSLIDPYRRNLRLSNQVRISSYTVKWNTYV